MFPLIRPCILSLFLPEKPVEASPLPRICRVREPGLLFADGNGRDQHNILLRLQQR
jgi:hypothetical protein